MGFISNVNKVLNAKSTGVFLFGFTGAYKVLTDYQRAPKEEKKKVLLRDSAILAGSALGLAGYSSARNTFIKSSFKKNSSKFFDKTFENIKKTNTWQNINKSIGKYFTKPTEIVLKNSYNILKDCVDNVLFVAAGIGGAVVSDYLIQIGHTQKKMLDNTIKQKTGIQLNKPVKKQEIKPAIPEKEYVPPFDKLKQKFNDKVTVNDFKYLNNMVDEETKKNILSNITNMPEMKIFNNTMIGIQSFEIAEEKTFKDKLRRTTHSLLTNTLVPMFFLSLSSNLTKNMKSLYRIPIVFTTMVAGTVATNKKIEEYHNNKQKINI